MKNPIRSIDVVLRILRTCGSIDVVTEEGVFHELSSGPFCSEDVSVAETEGKVGRDVCVLVTFFVDHTRIDLWVS